MWKKRIYALVLGLGIVLLPVGRAEASGEGRIAGMYTKEQELSVYVKGISEDIQEIRCQIGTRADQNVIWEKAEDMETPAKTLIMIDNSISITKENREKIKAFLKRERERGRQFLTGYLS